MANIFSALTEANYFLFKNDIYLGYNNLLELNQLLITYNEINDTTQKDFNFIENEILNQVIQSYNLLGVELYTSQKISSENSLKLLQILISCLSTYPYYANEFYDSLISNLSQLKLEFIINLNESRKNQLKKSPDQVIKMITELFIVRGEFNKAQAHINKFVTELDESEKEIFDPYWLKVSGQYKFYSDDISDAITDFEECLVGFIKSTNIVQQADVLTYLVHLYLKSDNLANAKKAYDQLDQLTKFQKNKNIEIRRKISYALIEKSLDRAKNKVNALAVFENIVKSKIIDHRLTILSCIHATEILMWELKDSKNEEIINEIENLIEKLTSIATHFSSDPLFIEIYLLQSRLSLLRLDIQNSLHWVEKAELLIENNQLNLYENKVRNYRNSLQTEISEWTELMNRNAPMIERLNTANIEKFFEKMINSITAIT